MDTPLTLRVVGETAGSRVWYMTFQSQVKPGIEILPQQALIRHKDRLFQPVAGSHHPLRRSCKSSNFCKGSGSHPNRIEMTIGQTSKKLKINAWESKFFRLEF
ncbi:MAG: hypothetical protein OEY18_16300 [Candidatus Aminicenantes bacterium]|nr:hypothetical protein [Candidatus Aminicenantes bacterium]